MSDNQVTQAQEAQPQVQAPQPLDLIKSTLKNEMRSHFNTFLDSIQHIPVSAPSIMNAVAHFNNALAWIERAIDVVNLVVKPLDQPQAAAQAPSVSLAPESKDGN